MGQSQHRHDDVFGDRRLMAEHVANRDALRHRFGIEKVQPRRDRLQQAKTRCRRKRGPPDMPDHNLRFRQQRRKLSRIALVSKDRGSNGVLTLARTRGATSAAKWPRNKAFICSVRQLR
jgi:hypothetical protein